jgi:hypothetical protein
MYNKKAQIELTLSVMFVFVSCFPVGFNKCLETSQLFLLLLLTVIQCKQSYIRTSLP